MHRSHLSGLLHKGHGFSNSGQLQWQLFKCQQYILEVTAVSLEETLETSYFLLDFFSGSVLQFLVGTHGVSLKEKTWHLAYVYCQLTFYLWELDYVKHLENCAGNANCDIPSKCGWKELAWLFFNINVWKSDLFCSIWKADSCQIELAYVLGTAAFLFKRVLIPFLLNFTLQQTALSELIILIIIIIQDL